MTALSCELRTTSPGWSAQTPWEEPTRSRLLRQIFFARSVQSVRRGPLEILSSLKNFRDGLITHVVPKWLIRPSRKFFKDERISSVVGSDPLGGGVDEDPAAQETEGEKTETTKNKNRRDFGGRSRGREGREGGDEDVERGECMML